MSDKVKTSINLDKEVYEFILQLSKQESRSVSQQINKVFIDMMQKKS
jgi:hypothetical protein